MTNKPKFKSCSLICPKCKNVQYINRRTCKLKRYGHIKPLWCYKCKKRTRHIEIDEFRLSKESE